MQLYKYLTKISGQEVLTEMIERPTDQDITILNMWVPKQQKFKI